jgi:hypothetical protein
MKHIVKFTDTGIGKVTEKAIFSELPEGYTVEEMKKHCSTIDNWRESRLSKVMHECMDYGEKNSFGNGDGVGLTVDKVPLGGMAKGSVYIDPCFRVTGSVEYETGDVMSAVLVRSGSLYAKHNITAPETTETDVE